MSPTALTLLLVVIAVLSSLGVGVVVGWMLRARREEQVVGQLEQASSASLSVAASQTHIAQAASDEMHKDMLELATQYRELHSAYEGLLATHNNTLIQLNGVEDELRVQQDSARVARNDAGSSRRRLGQLEGELRALQVVAAKAMNHP